MVNETNWSDLTTGESRGSSQRYCSVADAGGTGLMEMVVDAGPTTSRAGALGAPAGMGTTPAISQMQRRVETVRQEKSRTLQKKNEPLHCTGLSPWPCAIDVDVDVERTSGSSYLSASVFTGRK